MSSLLDLCAGRVSKVPTVTGMFSSRLKSASSHMGLSGGAALDQELTSDEAEALHTWGYSSAQSLPQAGTNTRGEIASTTGSGGGAENHQHHSTTKNHRDHRAERGWRTNSTIAPREPFHTLNPEHETLNPKPNAKPQCQILIAKSLKPEP